MTQNKCIEIEVADLKGAASCGAPKTHSLKFLNTKTAPALIQEIFSDNYKVGEQKIEFAPKDIVLDLGANEGMFSIFMACLFPEIHIFAYEPIPATFETLQENILLNGYENVITPIRAGVGRPGRQWATFNVSKDFSGGSTSMCIFNPEDHYLVKAPLISLDDIFLQNDIRKCRLMKMDIEGMEYEALYAATVLPLIDYTVMEVHMNSHLDYDGRRADGLVTWLERQTKLIHVDFCRMTD